MKTTDTAKIRQLLKQAKEGVEDLTPAGMCYPLYEEKQVVKNLDKALALLPCETCGGTGKKPRPIGERHCCLLLCQDLKRSCGECDCYLPPEPCPDCQS